MKHGGGAQLYVSEPRRSRYGVGLHARRLGFGEAPDLIDARREAALCDAQVCMAQLAHRLRLAMAQTPAALD